MLGMVCLTRIGFGAFAAVPLLVAIAQQPAPKAEEIYKDIEVFRGLPASDLIPAMQFMSASMGYKCTGCHEPNDYAAPHPMKDEARRMVLLQRDINERHFDKRLEVTCMTCHHKKEHPDSMPVPVNIKRRHQDLTKAMTPEQVLKRHVAAVGKMPFGVVRSGTLTAPNDETYKLETKPATLTQTADGRFLFVSGHRKFGFDGKTTWYGEYPMVDEPAAIFQRKGRTWLGTKDFDGLKDVAMLGKETLATGLTFIVSGYRASTQSEEELHFDSKTGRLVRLVNFRPSSIGTVVSAIDYGDYRQVGDAYLPMKITITYAEGEPWVLRFSSAKALKQVDAKQFQVGS